MYYCTGCNHCLISIKASIVVVAALKAGEASFRAWNGACSPINEAKITLCDE